MRPLPIRQNHMGHELLHYRVWKGDERPPWWTVWPIAHTALQLVWRRRLFWIFYAAGLLVFAMFFFGGYLLAWAETQLPSEPLQWGRFQLQPERLLRLVRQGLYVLNGSPDTYAAFFRYQSSIVVIVLALTGATLVGNDWLQGAVTFYLAKPLAPRHYLLGKCLAVGVIVQLLTTLPALVLYGQHVFDDWDYLLHADYFEKLGGTGPAGVPLLLGIIGYGLLLSLFLGILLVAVAAWARRTLPLVLAWTGLFFLLPLLAGLLVDGLHGDPHWRLLDLWNDLFYLGCALLQASAERLGPVPRPTTDEAALVLCGVSLVCLISLHLRLRRAAALS